ncbi:uncharacterized protein B0J16DRAFT_23561 [Fusarium flagelliforme]|uniref:Pci protein n=1 Tax=Fusarium flagelliforme TaxID=2675880 RepID=A0A395MV20_9HYPO|nr:uncharacterized protein B0J16DRAFT_23561 [Fusarium flagelliforme]KAH7197606.1 hypothetical protein B0J16DRAFT_23561 [Fusarium flagelliforme]RFN51587.1 pci protein [Fusarium flagelliforme]
MRSSFAILAMAISAVSAQSVKSYKSSLDMTLDDPNTVDLATRSGWCGAQQNTCDTLCGDNTNKNNCDDSTLKWECTCSSNSSAPGLQYYTQTIPTFICNQLTADCVAKTSTSEGTKECRTKIEPLCAEQAPPKNVASNDDDDDDDSSTTSGTATATATQTSSGASGSAEAVSTTASDAFAAPTMAPAGKGAAAAVALGMLAYLI